MIKPLSSFQTIISSSALKTQTGGARVSEECERLQQTVYFSPRDFVFIFLKGTFVFMFVVLFFKICVLCI